MGRAPCCDKANVKRGPWSPEEDATLKNYLHKHGTSGNWISLPQRAGLKRCGKSCRLRWLNYLRPDIKHGAFTEEEDNIIISLYYKMGSRWSVIAANLPGRTDNDVKNHWNTKLKKKLFGGSKNNVNKFNTSTNIPKIDVPFNYTNIFNYNYDYSNNYNNNNNNSTISQAPNSSSTTPNTSPSPSYVDNNHNPNHDNYHHNNPFYVPFTSFSNLLAQCSSTSNSPTMSLLPNLTIENQYSNTTTTIYDPIRSQNYSARYPVHQLSSVLTDPENVGPVEEATSVYGSSLEEDPYFTGLGFGSIQELMMNNNPTCGYGDQEDIKPQGLGQSVAN